MRRCVRLLAAILVLQAGCAYVGRGRAAEVSTADVYVVLVDGLAVQAAAPDHMPHLAAAVGTNGSWLTASAVMPTRTNPNHASLLTGVQPSAHGITGNYYWDGTAEREMGEASLLEVETIFTAVERQRPALTTVTAFAKGKLRHLFGMRPGRQTGPDFAWRPPNEDVYAATDDETMDGYRLLVGRYHPAFSIVALAGVDATGHGAGPDSDAYRNAVTNADRLIGLLIDDLVRTDRWDRSIVMVTADHGFDALLPGARGHIGPDAVVAGGAHFVADGGTAHVYAGHAGSLDATIAKASRHPGVATVYARAPRRGAPAPPAEWHATNPRMGDLILIARPGFTFIDGPQDRTCKFRGDHGGPGEIPIPLIIVGGHPALRKAPAGERASIVDVVPTVAQLLDVAPPRRIDGTPVAAPDAGRALSELLGGQ